MCRFATHRFSLVYLYFRLVYFLLRGKTSSSTFMVLSESSGGDLHLVSRSASFRGQMFSLSEPTYRSWGKSIEFQSAVKSKKERGEHMRSMKSWFVLATVLGVTVVIGLMATPSTLAQTTTTGGVAGTVTDPSGAVVPDVKISLKSLERGTAQDTNTNKDGFYRFGLLEPGKYSVTATAAGFQTAVRDASVAVGQVSVADLQLTLGVTTQTVEVTAQIPLLQAEQGNLANTVNESQAANIPNPGNDLTYMAQIAPGSVSNTAGGGLGNFSSYGISAVANLFTVNGMDDNDPFLNVNNSGATNLTLGQNEVQEVAIVTNGYSGQYGGLAGANVNYITRGGTNAFHGRATWYWNGRKLNANSWFNNARNTPRSFVNANQYGADIGGPIIKNKLFFYANFEGLYLVIPTSATTVIPSPAFAAATQANINTTFGAGSTISKFYQTMFSLYAGAPGAGSATNSVPLGGCDGTLPAGLGFSVANPCALQFQSNVSNKTHEHLEAYRIDWNVTSRDQFFGRIQKDRGLQASFTDPINSLFNIQSDQPEWQGQAQLTHAFSGGAVNQFIASGQWYSAIFGNASQSATLAAFPSNLFFASSQFTALGGIDFNFPQGRRVTQFQISDDFSKPRGAHTFKVGLKFRRNWVSNTDYSIFSTGQLVAFTESALFTGGVNGDIILLQSFPTSKEQPFAVYSLGGYVEDDWKVKPNLTLTLSLRLDHPSNPVCFHKCFARPVTQFPDLSSSSSTPYNQLMLTNQSTELPDLTGVAPQPRVGIAWQPHFMKNTVLRGGIGIFYDAFPGALLDGFSENPPLDPQFVVAGGTLSSPSDPASLFALAAGSNASFQNGFASGGSFSTISASNPFFSPPSLAVSQNHPKAPQYQKWSLEVEHQFGQNTSVTLQYVGNHAIHIYTQNSGINGCNNLARPASGGNPAKPGFTSLPTCLTAPGTGAAASGMNPSFLTVNYAESIGVSNYNGLTAAFTHRYKSGQVQVNYSWSHALDTVSNSGIPSDAFGNTSFLATNNSMVFPEKPGDPRFNYASADYDARHILNANYIWELPVKHYVTRGHGPDRLLNGWTVNGGMFFRTGFPFTIIDGGTTSALQSGGYGSGNSLVNVFGTQTAAGGTGANCQKTFTTTTQPNAGICLNPADFTTSPNGFGNLGRNTIRGPVYWNTDFSLMKHTKITERTEFVLGAQFFNVFNHPNFDAPLADASATRFGQIQKTVSGPTTMFGSVLGADASPRLVQLKLQFNF
jgi:carboxypeptidase family protein